MKLVGQYPMYPLSPHLGDLDEYSISWLAYHLYQSGHCDMLRALLLFPQYVQTKLLRKGPDVLLQDYEYVSESDEFSLIAKAIRMSAHVLADDPKQLPGHLIGRLAGDCSERINQFIQAVAENTSGSWIEPLDRILIAPGALSRTFWAPFETFLVCIACNGTVSAATRHGGFKVWDIESGEMRVRIDDGTTPCALAVVGEGTIGVSADPDGVIKLWDLSSGQLIREMLSTALRHRRNGGSKSKEGSSGYITPYLSLTPDGKSALIVYNDPPHPHQIEFWDLQEGSCQLSLASSLKDDAIGAFRSDCPWLLPVSGKTHDAHRRETKTLNSPYVVIGNHLFVSGTTFARDQSLAATCDSDGTIRIWYPASLGARQVFKTNEPERHEIVLTPDGSMLLAGDSKGRIYAWDTKTGDLRARIDAHGAEITGLSVSPDGRSAASCGKDNKIRIWDIDGIIREFSAKQLASSVRKDLANSDRFTPFKFSSDGRVLFGLTKDNTVQARDLGTAVVLGELGGPIEGCWPLPHGDQLLVLVSSQSGYQCRLVEVKEGNVLDSVDLEERSRPVVSLSRDGRFAALGTEAGSIMLWDLNTGNFRRLFRGSGGKPIPGRTERVNYPVQSIAVTQNGRFVVSGKTDGSVEVWDGYNGALIRTFTRSRGAVADIVITSDTRRIISAHYVSSVYVWDVAAGSAICELKTTGLVSQLVLSQDSRFLLGAGGHSFTIWDLGVYEVNASLTLDDFIVDAVGQCDRDKFAFILRGNVHFFRWRNAP